MPEEGKNSSFYEKNGFEIDRKKVAMSLSNPNTPKI